MKICTTSCATVSRLRANYMPQQTPPKLHWHAEYCNLCNKPLHLHPHHSSEPWQCKSTKATARFFSNAPNKVARMLRFLEIWLEVRSSAATLYVKDHGIIKLPFPKVDDIPGGALPQGKKTELSKWQIAILDNLQLHLSMHQWDKAHKEWLQLCTTFQTKESMTGSDASTEEMPEITGKEKKGTSMPC